MSKRKAYAVIGANYGDEGKGLIVDWLASQHSNALVVRFNGTAQAGHTVVDTNGVRHVFRHFGSGTFCGATTALAPQFYCHPMLFRREWEELSRLGFEPKVIVDPQCRLVTPYDVMVNQAIERHRANKRHGSCGVGFGEAVERSSEFMFDLQFAELETVGLRSVLRCIRDRWVPWRLAQLGVKWLPDALDDQAIFENFIRDCEFMSSKVGTAIEDRANFETLIFEGAQGLALSQGSFSKENPHVTRSHTGIRHPLLLARTFEFSELEAIYVTRSYLTRHGPGDMDAFEASAVDKTGMSCATNKPNEFQGDLRFSGLDLADVEWRIRWDLGSQLGSGIEVTPVVAMTHIDQRDHVWRYADKTDVPYYEAAQKLSDRLGRSRTAIFSGGPTRGDVSRRSI